MIADERPLGAHLVGSVPLSDEDEVFHAAARILGGHLRRMPDGETGERSMWIAWQRQVFEDNPDFEMEAPSEGDYAPLERFRVRAGVDAERLRFESLGYAAAAESSWIRFDALQSRGIIPPEIRFQVSLPTALAPVSQFIVTDDRARVEPAYQAAMARELERILANIDHDRLAIQWDVAIEMGMLEGLSGLFEPWFQPVKNGILERLRHLAEAVPEDVEMGLHLCYGDFGHAHFVQPADSGRLVELANSASAAVSRSLQWVHMPVPVDRFDSAYYEPLGSLQLQDETELYLGLVHHRDGLEGAQRRITAARRFVPRFGVATECGFGRRAHKTVHPLLELHRALSAPVR
jgi:hypothetical protein